MGDKEKLSHYTYTKKRKIYDFRGGGMRVKYQGDDKHHKRSA